MHALLWKRPPFFLRNRIRGRRLRIISDRGELAEIEVLVVTLVTSQLLEHVGRTMTFVAPEAVGAASIRYFALALDDLNPLYLDRTVAAVTRYGDIVAPPTFVCESIQYANERPNEDGYIGPQWALPLPPCRAIRGGHDYEFFEAVRPTDRLTVHWTLSDIFERDTRKRGALLFVVSDVEYRNQAGTLLARNRETLIYEPLDRGSGDE